MRKQFYVPQVPTTVQLQVMIGVQSSVVERAFSPNLHTVPTCGHLSVYLHTFFSFCKAINRLHWRFKRENVSIRKSSLKLRTDERAISNKFESFYTSLFCTLEINSA